MSDKLKLFALLALLAVFVGSSESANILGLFTTTSPSHNIVHMAYLQPLIERGHNVTVVTAIPLKDKNPKYHHILIPLSETRMQEMADMKSEVAKKHSIFKTVQISIKSVWSFGPTILADPLRDRRFQELLENPDNKFDLVVIGYFFNPFYVGVGAHFRCPVVLSYANAPNSLTNSFIGNPAELSYVPVSPLFGLPDLTTFKGRLTNFMVNTPVSILTALMDIQMEGIYNEIFSPTEYPSYKEAKKKVSLILFNYHFTDGIVRPNVPAAVECGGIQIKDKPDPLPEDLQKLFNASSEHGVIYVSFGSNLGINDINPDVLTALFNVLSGLKQTVLWKWADSKKPGTAPNVHYSSWLPQDDLLQHPNLKLFITHAGKGGTTEAAYHGVPMVAVPMIADQIGNAAQMVKDGFGLQVDKKTVTEDIFKSTISEVLTNPAYLENVKRFSNLTKDRPMTPKQTAVFWLEYVLRHKGAYHMQSPAVHLNTLQVYSLDVIGFLCLIAFVVYKLVSIPLKFVLKRLLAWRASKAQKIKQQ